MDPIAELVGSLLTSKTPDGLRYGIVTTIGPSSPLTVRVGAAATAVTCKALSGFHAHVGDLVAVFVTGADRLVLGVVDPATNDETSWQNIADTWGFQNGWSAYYYPQWCRRGHSIYLRGAITNGTLGAAFTTVPTGLRPEISEARMTLGPQNGMTGWIQSNTDGTLVPNQRDSDNDWISLVNTWWDIA